MSGYFARLAAQAAPGSARASRSTPAGSQSSPSSMTMTSPARWSEGSLPGEAAAHRGPISQDATSSSSLQVAFDASSDAHGARASTPSDESFPTSARRVPPVAHGSSGVEDVAMSATHAVTRSVTSSIDAPLSESTVRSRDASTGARDSSSTADQPVDGRGRREGVGVAQDLQVPTTTTPSTPSQAPVLAVAAVSTNDAEPTQAPAQDVIETADAFAGLPLTETRTQADMPAKARAELPAADLEDLVEGQIHAASVAEGPRAVVARGEAAIDAPTTAATAASRAMGRAAAPQIRIGQIALEVHVAPPPSRPAAPPVPQPTPMPAAAPAPPRFSARRHYLRWG